MRMISNLLHPAVLIPRSQRRRTRLWMRIREACILFPLVPSGCLCRHCPLCRRLSICGGFFLPVQTRSDPRRNHRCHRRPSQQYLFLLSLRRQCPLHRRKGKLHRRPGLLQLSCRLHLPSAGLWLTGSFALTSAKSYFYSCKMKE